MWRVCYKPCVTSSRSNTSAQRCVLAASVQDCLRSGDVIFACLRARPLPFSLARSRNEFFILWFLFPLLCHFVRSIIALPFILSYAFLFLQGCLPWFSYQILLGFFRSLLLNVLNLSIAVLIVTENLCLHDFR